MHHIERNNELVPGLPHRERHEYNLIQKLQEFSGKIDDIPYDSPDAAPAISSAQILAMDYYAEKNGRPISKSSVVHLQPWEVEPSIDWQLKKHGKYSIDISDDDNIVKKHTWEILKSAAQAWRQGGRLECDFTNLTKNNEYLFRREDLQEKLLGAITEYEDEEKRESINDRIENELHPYKRDIIQFQKDGFCQNPQNGIPGKLKKNVNIFQFQRKNDGKIFEINEKNLSKSLQNFLLDENECDVSLHLETMGGDPYGCFYDILEKKRQNDVCTEFERLHATLGYKDGAFGFLHKEGRKYIHTTNESSIEIPERELDYFVKEDLNKALENGHTGLEIALYRKSSPYGKRIMRVKPTPSQEVHQISEIVSENIISETIQLLKSPPPIDNEFREISLSDPRSTSPVHITIPALSDEAREMFISAKRENQQSAVKKFLTFALSAELDLDKEKNEFWQDFIRVKSGDVEFKDLQHRMQEKNPEIDLTDIYRWDVCKRGEEYHAFPSRKKENFPENFSSKLDSLPPLITKRLHGIFGHTLRDFHFVSPFSEELEIYQYPPTTKPTGQRALPSYDPNVCEREKNYPVFSHHNKDDWPENFVLPQEFEAYEYPPPTKPTGPRYLLQAGAPNIR